MPEEDSLNFPFRKAVFSFIKFYGAVVLRESSPSHDVSFTLSNAICFTIFSTIQETF